MVRWWFAALVVFALGAPARAEFGPAERAYSNGDIEGALREFEAGGAAGDGESLFTLGVIYARGVDVQRDYATAYKWICLSDHMGAESAGRHMNVLIRLLSHEEIREIEKGAAEWLEDHPQGMPFTPCYNPG